MRLLIISTAVVALNGGRLGGQAETRFSRVDTNFVLRPEAPAPRPGRPGDA